MNVRRYIFRLQDLSMGRLASAMGLLRLPAMPELKKGAEGDLEGFTPSSVDPASVHFKDKTREKQHQASLKKATATAEAEREARGVAKAKRIKAQAQDQAAGNRLTAFKRRQLQQRDELEELQTEYRLLQKLKRGKISGHDFDVATGLSDESDDEDDGGGGGGNTKAGGGGQGGAGAPLGRKTAEYLDAKHKRKKRRSGGQAGGPAGGN
jgi:ATP-dependent RNA helicase DDX55/SPB4